MLYLLLLMTTSSEHQQIVQVRSRVTVRVISGSTRAEEDWLKSKKRTERVIVDEKGRQFKLRLVEFE
jgi:hypothetical protein